MLRPPSLVVRGLEPLVHALWTFFIVWSVIVVGLWMGGEQSIASIAHPDLRAAATLLVRAADALWLVLAAANVYLHLAEKEGLPRARLIAFTIGLTAAGFAACSAWTGYPLGAVFYTTRLGMKLGPVPLGWPLLWFVIIVGGRELAARVLPKVSERALATITGGLALLTDLNLEPIATKFRLYWFWYVAGSHEPSPVLWRNSATWLFAAIALAWLLRDRKVASLHSPSWRPGLILIIFNVMLLLAHLRRMLFA